MRRVSIFNIIAVTAALVVASLASQTNVSTVSASAPSAENCASIRAAVQKEIANQHVPGTAYIVVDHGSIVCQAGIGTKNIATKTSIDVDTRFEIGSITKQFTAAAILQLKEAGKLSLDDGLAKYIPAYTRGKDVTIRQLLWQVSGVPEFLAVGDYMHTVTTRPGTFAATMALIENLPLDFKPGTRWEYSSTNYEILGRIVEIASGDDWAHYVRTHLFAPARMTHSTFIEAESSTPDMATGYYTPKTSVIPSPSSGHWFWAAGAIVSTVGDMAKWNSALFGNQVVSKADLSRMTSLGPVHGLPGYGFGMQIGQHLWQKLIGHDGETLGFASVAEFYPKFGETIVVLENHTDGYPETIANQIFDSLHPSVVAESIRPVRGEDQRVTARAKEWLHRFEVGDIDRSQLAPLFAKGTTSGMVAELKSTYKGLGTPTLFVYRGKQFFAGTTVYTYLAEFKGAPTFSVTIGLDEHGKIAAWGVQPADFFGAAP